MLGVGCMTVKGLKMKNIRFLQDHMEKLSQWILCMLIIVLNLMSIAEAAKAPTQGIYFTIKNRWNNAYLIDDGTDLHYKATNPGANTAYQWAFISRGGPYYDIKNRKTGDLINIEKLQDAVQSDRSAPPLVGDSSKWAIEQASGDYFRLRNGWHIGDYLHIQDLKGYVQHGMMYPIWDSAQWQITQVSTAYSFKSTLSQKCFILGGSNTDLALQQIASCDVTDNNQVWMIKPTGKNKKYTIVAVKNNQCLDSATTPPATAVCNAASSTQAWKVELVSSSGQEDKRYRFRQGSQCLAIATSGEMDQQDSLSLVPCDNGNNQLFQPIKGGVVAPPDSSNSASNTLTISTTNQPNATQPANSINALDFGVVGDGKTDNQVALQKAADAAKAQGAILWIPAGVYNHSDVITMDSIRVQGAGPKTVLNATNPDKEAIILKGSNSLISNLKTTVSAPNRSSMPNDCAILVVGTSGASVHHLVIQGAASNGVRFDNVSNSSIYSNLIMGTNADGVELANGSTGNTVKNNVVYQAADMSYADYSFLGEKAQDEHNTFDTNLSLNNTYGMGFSLAGAKNDTVKNNIVSGSLWYGIWADSDPTSDTMDSSGNIILNNTVINNPDGDPVKATGPGMTVSGTQTTGSVPSTASILGWDPGSFVDRYSFNPSYKPGTGPGAVNTSGNRQ